MAVQVRLYTAEIEQTYHKEKCSAGFHLDIRFDTPGNFRLIDGYMRFGGSLSINNVLQIFHKT